MAEQRKILLIGCSAGKVEHEATARELYTGASFIAARSYAEATGAEWYILSAGFRVVLPGRVLPPYNLTLDAAVFRRQWNQEVGGYLECLVQHDAEAEFTVLAGQHYCEWASREARGTGTHTRFGTLLTVKLPLTGMGIGQQRAYLARLAKEAQDV